MSSLIDPTKPTYKEALTSDVRNNFNHAKQEIEALQNAIQLGEGVYLPLSGGKSMTGYYNLYNDAISPLQPVPLRQLQNELEPFHDFLINVADYFIPNRTPGVTDDYSAWQSALNEAVSRGGATITAPPGTVSLITQNINISNSNIRFHLPNVRMLMSGANITNCFNFQGSSVAGPTLSVPVAQYDNTLTVSALNGLVEGDYIMLARRSVLDLSIASNYSFVGKVRTITGTGPFVIQLNNVLPFSIADTDPQFLFGKFLPLENVGVTGVIIDGTAATNTTACHGIYAYSLINSIFKDISGINISNGGIVFGFWGHHNIVENIEGINCGSQNVAAVQLYNQTNSQCNNIRLEQCTGFGVVLPGWSYGTGTGFIINGCYLFGRGFKIQAALFNNFSNFSSNFNHSNGVALAYASCYNTLSGISSNGNLISEGLWLDDQNNCNNIFFGVNAFGNATRDIYIGPTDLNNMLFGVNAGVITNQTTTTTFFSAGQAPNTHFPTITVDDDSTFGTDTASTDIHVSINGPANSGRIISFKTAGLQRWTVLANNESETGGNVGSNFRIGRWDDAGTALNVVVSIDRATGKTTFANDVLVTTGFAATGGFGVFQQATVNTRPVVSGSRAGNAALTSLLTALASYGLITNSTTA